MNFKEVNWGMIGCGNVSEVKSGPAFSLIEHSSLHAVMSRNADKAKDYARRHKVPKCYRRAEDLFDDKNINAIYIATPPDVHASLTIDALKAGKAVYVEKPMALNYQQCSEMIEVARQTSMPLFVAYYRRSLKYFIKIKELIEEGVLGEVYHCTIRFLRSASEKDYDHHNLPWRVKPEIAGAGYFFDLASHQLDFLIYLFGPLDFVKGIATNRAGLYPAEDQVSALLRFKNGVDCSGYWNFVTEANCRSDEAVIYGSKGRLEFSFFDFNPIRLDLYGVSSHFEFERPKHIQQDFIQSVVDELRGVGKCPGDMISASETNNIMEEIVKDYYRNR